MVRHAHPPGVVKVRVSGAPADVLALAEQITACAGTGFDVIEVSAAYANRKGPGVRAYLTLRLTDPTDRPLPAHVAP